jgi:hypothetical protein
MLLPFYLNVGNVALKRDEHPKDILIMKTALLLHKEKAKIKNGIMTHK